MASEADQKIRRVAIVLQSMDSATARELLGQFPNTIARDVRRAMANLGSVPAAERAAAMSELQGLIAPSATTRIAQKNATSNPSPAVQLLSQATNLQDTIQFSSAAVQSSDATPASFAPLNGNHDASNTEVGHAWLDIQPAFLAQLLQNERAIVIAAVINELPVTLATPVLQHLPVNIATETMAVLPGLHRTDPMILQELLDQMKRKVAEATQAQQQNATGLDKLRAIVASVPNDQRGLWATALGTVDPLLTSKLGWSSQSSSPTKEPQHATDARMQVADRSLNEISDEIDEVTKPIPIPGLQKGEQNHRLRTLSDLLTLDDSELVEILHAVNPQSVLLALSNADRKILYRIERLIPKRDLKRFRERLSQLQSVSLREIDSACEELLVTASRLVDAANSGSKNAGSKIPRGLSAAA